ncbi:hypothetical protein AOLI_G00161030 [Acnodon oligacanthus]
MAQSASRPLGRRSAHCEAWFSATRALLCGNVWQRVQPRYSSGEEQTRQKRDACCWFGASRFGSDDQSFPHSNAAFHTRRFHDVSSEPQPSSQAGRCSQALSRRSARRKSPFIPERNAGQLSRHGGQTWQRQWREERRRERALLKVFFSPPPSSLSPRCGLSVLNWREGGAVPLHYNDIQSPHSFRRCLTVFGWQIHPIGGSQPSHYAPQSQHTLATMGRTKGEERGAPGRRGPERWERNPLASSMRELPARRRRLALSAV